MYTRSATKRFSRRVGFNDYHHATGRHRVCCELSFGGVAAGVPRFTGDGYALESTQTTGIRPEVNSVTRTRNKHVVFVR